MKKHVFKFVFYVALAIALLYPLLSFSAWSFNIAKWANFERFIFGIALGACVAVLIADLFSKKHANGGYTKV